MRLAALAVSVASLLAAPAVALCQDPVLILDARDGKGIQTPVDVERDSAGTIYIANAGSDNVLRRMADGTTDLFLPSTGDGQLQLLIDPTDLQLDLQGRLYVTGGGSNNVFRVDPDGTVEVVLDSTGVGGQALSVPQSMALDGAGNLFIGDTSSVFKITPDGTASLVLDSTGVPGGAFDLFSPKLRPGLNGDLYVLSDAFIFGMASIVHIPFGGAPIELFGAVSLDPIEAKNDAAGNLYVLGRFGALYKITPAGVDTLLLSAGLSGGGGSMAVKADGTLWFSGTQNVQGQLFSLLVEVSPEGVASPLPINSLMAVGDLALDSSDNLFYTVSGCQLMKRPPGGPASLVADASNVALGSCAGMVMEPDGQFLVWHFKGLQRIALDASVELLIDATANGLQFTYDQAGGIGVSSNGDLYATNQQNDTVLRVDADTGAVSVILDATGDGLGQTLWNPRRVVVDSNDNVFVVAEFSDNVFRVAPDGTVTTVLDASGDGTHPFDWGWGLAVDSQDNVYASGGFSDNVFKIEPNGTITQIADSHGAGPGALLNTPLDLAVDGYDNVYVAGASSQNVLRITPTGVITQLITESGDGQGNTLGFNEVIAVGRDGTLYVLDIIQYHLFRVTPEGDISVVLDTEGDGINALIAPKDVVVDRFGSAYVSVRATHNVFRVDANNKITQIFVKPPSMVPFLDWPAGVAIDGQDRLYVVGDGSDNVWRFDGPPLWPDLGGAVAGALGEPELSLRGPLSPGSTLDRALENVPPETLLLAWVSTTSTPFSFKGGTVHAYPFVLQVFMFSDALGRSVLSLEWPAGLASGTDVYLQFLVQDPSVPGGLGLSNAAMSTTP